MLRIFLTHLRSHMGALVKLKNPNQFAKHKYELFKLHDSQTISEMFTHFINIVNGLKALSRSFSNVELVSKILQSLTKKFEPKVTAIFWHKGHYQTWTKSNYQLPHYSRDDHFEWRWEEQKGEGSCSQGSDDDDFNDEDIPLQQVRKDSYRGRKDAINMPKQKSELDKGGRKCCVLLDKMVHGKFKQVQTKATPMKTKTHLHIFVRMVSNPSWGNIWTLSLWVATLLMFIYLLTKLSSF